MSDASPSTIPHDDQVSVPSPVNPPDIAVMVFNLVHLNVEENISDSSIQPAPSESPADNFHQLPPELMAEIFTIACHANYHNFQRDKERSKMITPFVLGHVCGRWRAIVWSTPETWSHILLCLALSRYDTQVALLKGWLSRSGGCPLVIEFNFQDEDDWSDEVPMELVQLLASHSPRWHSINWVLPEAWYNILYEIRHNVPLLKSVSTQPLWSDCHMAASMRQRFDLFQFAPRLHDIHLNGYYLADVAIPWKQITRFTLQHVYLDECFYGLLKTPHITFCRIYTILSDDHRVVVKTPIKLLSMESLVLFGATWEDTIELLSSMSAPALKTLEFASPQDEDFPSLTPLLLKLKCRLTHLKLTDFIFGKEDESELLEFVRDIPSLQELDIELQASSTPVSNFLVELLKAQPPPPDQEATEEIYFLPSLKRFAFSGPLKAIARFDEGLLDVLQLRRVSRLLSSFDLKTQDEYEHVLTPAVKEKFQSLVNDGLRLSIVFDRKSWL